MFCYSKHAVLLFISVAFAVVATGQSDSSADEKRSLDFVNSFVKDSVFIHSVQQIKSAAALTPVEHCIAFGKDSLSRYTTSIITEGNNSSGNVPAVLNAFADLHNHNNNLPPDAGDLYGLLSICKNNPGYTTRFVITANGILYALVIVNSKAAFAFVDHFPAQKPVAPGLQPAFPEKIVDEFRELKFQDFKTDEQALNYILKKYNTVFLHIKVN